MTEYYFIRHGQTEANVQKIHQFDTTPLSENGKWQVYDAAERLKGKGIQLLVSSPLTRAHQTAAILADVLHLPLIFHDDLAEMKRPSSFAGKSYTDPATLLIKDKMHHNPHYRHEDGETFAELHTRARHFLDFLKQREGEKIACITHGRILKMLLTTMILPQLTNDFYKTFNFFEPENGGITTCKYTATDGWKLLSWNDTSTKGGENK